LLLTGYLPRNRGASERLAGPALRLRSDESLVQVKVQQGRGEAGTAQHAEVGLERERMIVVVAARVYEVVG